MDVSGWFTLALTFSVLLVLITTRIAPHVVMLAAMTVLSVTGVLSPAEALAGFSNSGLITVGVMFVIAAGIHHSGGIDILVNKFLGSPKNLRTALLRIFIPVVPLSAFLNNTPVVATMIPAIMTWAKKNELSPSKLLIPLSYTAILGGTITLIGTSTNLVVNGQYQSITGNPGFGLFDITFIGLPVAIVGMIFIYVISPFLLPNTQENKPFSELREFTLEVCVTDNGPLVGKSIAEAGLRNLKRLYLVEIERASKTLSAVSSDEILYGNDRLVFAGQTEAITDLLKINGLEAPPYQGEPVLDQKKSGRVLVEVVVSTHCEAVGSAIRDSKFRNRYGAAVLAVARNGERLKSNLGGIKIQSGDTLLLEARPAFISRQKYSKDFLLVNALEHEQPNHEKANLSWGILICAVLSASLGLTSMLNAALIGAGLMLATGCLSIKQAEKSLDLAVILTIAASFSLGLALQKTGVASFIADNIISISAGNALLLLILTYITVSILTEIITNNAAAVLILPIIIEITDKATLNSEPYIFAIMMAASASFATPLGYQTNLMVYGPGNYGFKDFLKIGLLMNLIIAIATVTILSLFWSLEIT
ncbi:SLC13 family permease [Aliiglaciecola aliphaticivorans]